jgi:hypothetical protein
MGGGFPNELRSLSDARVLSFSILLLWMMANANRRIINAEIKIIPINELFWKTEVVYKK